MSTATDAPVLVIAPQWVGDAILSLPLIEELAQSHGAVDVLAIESVEAVYHCAPSVRSVISVNFKRGTLELQKRRAIAAELRGQYGIAVILPNSFKSALIPWLARIPVRRGMTGEMRQLLLTDRRNPPDQVNKKRFSMLHHYLQLSDETDERGIEPSGKHRPKMMIDVARQALGQHGLTTNALDDFLDRRILAICPGAEYGPAKQWPAESFAVIVNDWIGQSDSHRVIILGSPADVRISQSIMAHVQDHSRTLNLCGKTKLLEAFAWIAKSTQVVSNDSGLMHAAAALDIPVIGIFGSSDPQHTPPHSPRAQTLSLQLACSPCFKRVCPLGTTACLKTLEPARVIQAINALAADAPAAPREVVHASR